MIQIYHIYNKYIITYKHKKINMQIQIQPDPQADGGLYNEPISLDGKITFPLESCLLAIYSKHLLLVGNP